MTSGASLSRFLDSAPLNDGLRKRMASHQSIHSVGSAGQMADIGHQQRKQTAFQAGRRTTSKSSLASDDWDLNIADVDSLNLDDWRWSESQNGANLGAFGSRDFLRARGDQGLSVGGLSAGLPASDLPRSRSKEAITAIRPPADFCCGRRGGRRVASTSSLGAVDPAGGLIPRLVGGAPLHATSVPAPPRARNVAKGRPLSSWVVAPPTCERRGDGVGGGRVVRRTPSRRLRARAGRGCPAPRGRSALGQ